MNDSHPSTSITDQATYEIRLQGHLPQRWIEWFGAVSVELEADGVTRVTCPALDQAALHGLLRKVRDLGLPLVSVNRVTPSDP